MIDCGLFQGSKDDREKNRTPLPIFPKNLDAIILTHAHLDHTGYIPLITKNGFTGKIYATHATYELSKVILPDSGFLQEEDFKFALKHNLNKLYDAEPLYTQEDAVASLGEDADLTEVDPEIVENYKNVRYIKRDGKYYELTSSALIDAHYAELTPEVLTVRVTDVQKKKKDGKETVVEKTVQEPFYASKSYVANPDGEFILVRIPAHGKDEMVNISHQK